MSKCLAENHDLKVVDASNFFEVAAQKFAKESKFLVRHFEHPKNKLVCNSCLQKAWQETKAISSELKNRFNFRKIKIVYSGKGFHIHVQDKKADKLTKQERISLTKNSLAIQLTHGFKRQHRISALSFFIKRTSFPHYNPNKK